MASDEILVMIPWQASRKLRLYTVVDMIRLVGGPGTQILGSDYAQSSTAQICKRLEAVRDRQVGGDEEGRA